MKKNIFQIIGAAAFIIGGIVTREKAMEAAEVLDKKFSKNKPSETACE